MRYSRRWKKIVREFTRDFAAKAEKNPALPVLAIRCYSASKHRSHIYSIWELFGRHKEVQAEYHQSLHGRHLTGKDEILNDLHFACPELAEKYRRKIPEQLAMGAALSVGYAVLRKRNRG